MRIREFSWMKTIWAHLDFPHTLLLMQSCTSGRYDLPSVRLDTLTTWPTIPRVN